MFAPQYKISCRERSLTVPGFRCICHNEIYNKAPTSSYFSVSKTEIYIFSQFPFVFLTQIFKIRIYAYSSTVQFYDNYFRSIVNAHWNNTVSNTSAHNHSCSILCIDACVIFREKSLIRSNNSSQNGSRNCPPWACPDNTKSIFLF